MVFGWTRQQTIAYSWMAGGVFIFLIQQGVIYYVLTREVPKDEEEGAGADAGAGGGPLGEEFDCTEVTNNLRSLHGAPPLQRDDALIKLAAEWTYQQFVTKNPKGIEHRPSGQYGENIAKGPTDDYVDCKKAADAWYSEKENYDWETGKAKDIGKDIRHFTCLVWDITKSIGCAKLIKGNDAAVVCNYSPGCVDAENQAHVKPIARLLFRQEDDPNKELDGGKKGYKIIQDFVRNDKTKFII